MCVGAVSAVLAALALRCSRFLCSSTVLFSSEVAEPLPMNPRQHERSYMRVSQDVWDQLNVEWREKSWGSPLKYCQNVSSEHCFPTTTVQAHHTGAVLEPAHSKLSALWASELIWKDWDNNIMHLWIQILTIQYNSDILMMWPAHLIWDPISRVPFSSRWRLS